MTSDQLPVTNRKPPIEGSDVRIKQAQQFHIEGFLSRLGVGRTVEFKKKESIFQQGSPSSAVFFIQKGAVKLTVLSRQGKEMAIGLLNAGDFLGEECIAPEEGRRLSSANAVIDCSVLKIEKRDITRVLHEEHVFSDAFIAYLLIRNSRIQSDLIDHLFNSSEKRLARALLLLACFAEEGEAETIVPNISQETLAEMIGTTRSRVNFFMTRFRKLGFIEYNGVLKIHRSLLSLVLYE